MDKKLYKLMNWPEIEGITYSEHAHPHKILGPHEIGTSTLVQAFWPEAKEIIVKLVNSDKMYKMEIVDEAGFFACLIPGKLKQQYKLIVTDNKDEKIDFLDAYQFQPLTSKMDIERFQAGTHYELYNILGAHIKIVDNIIGTSFLVWAPNALRVSVVGNFNHWDGRVHPMSKSGESGIFELFIPEISENEEYQYEIKIKGGMVYLKVDPFANTTRINPMLTSVVTDLNDFPWQDEEFVKNRSKIQGPKVPVSVYELHLNAFAKKEDGSYSNYKELAEKIIEYVKEMGYTHVEIMPITEYIADNSMGYQVVSFFAPTGRYGTPKDFMAFVNELHGAKIGVILDWVSAFFPKDNWGLSGFDGTCLFEPGHEKRKYHGKLDSFLFDYGKKEVSNFLIASALFWIEKYHVDGIRIGETSSMLYHSYEKNLGDWLPNIYGGPENLEAIEFIKHLNSIIHLRDAGVITVSEEVTAWPQVTGSLEEGGLGFDYKWNDGWSNDFIDYLQYDPFFRSGHHAELTFSMVYAYSEKFILSFSHNEFVRGKAGMLGKMPGESKDKFSNLRAAFGYMFTHPGKKHMFMGQDIGTFEAWSHEKEIKWDLLEINEHKTLNNYVKTLNKLYRSYPALNACDYETRGFEWINNFSANECVLIFLRKEDLVEDTLLVVANFAKKTYEDYKLGVPYSGKYKEILNSDQVEFGGEGFTNKRTKTAKKSECDGRDYSITIQLAPLSLSIYEFVPFSEAELEKIGQKQKASDDKKAEKSSLKEEIAKKFAVCEEEIFNGLEFNADVLLDAPLEVKEVKEKKVVKKSGDEMILEVKKPAEKKLVEKKSVEKKPVEKKPAEKKPVEKKSVEKKLVKKNSEVKKPVTKNKK